MLCRLVLPVTLFLPSQRDPLKRVEVAFRTSVKAGECCDRLGQFHQKGLISKTIIMMSHKLTPNTSHRSKHRSCRTLLDRIKVEALQSISIVLKLESYWLTIILRNDARRRFFISDGMQLTWAISPAFRALDPLFRSPMAPSSRSDSEMPLATEMALISEVLLLRHYFWSCARDSVRFHV